MTIGDLPTVLFVNTPAQMGGSNRSMVNILQSLEGRVRRVLASPSFGDFRSVVEAEGLAEELIDLPRKPGSPVDRALRVLAGLKLAWWVLRHRGDLSAIHANALTGLNLSVPASLIHKGPIVVWIHDPVGSKWGSRLGPVIKRLVPRLRIAAVSRTAEAVAVENGLCSAGDATLIPNPIDPADVVAARAPRTNGKISIGVLGGASHRKGFDLLPDTIELIDDDRVVWDLYISSVVEPGMEATWERLDGFPEGRVRLHEKVFDVSQVYAKLDIVYCPSRNESFCRVAAEAMLNGIPVVGSDIEPLRNLLGDDEAGLVFRVENAEEAADSLRRLIQDEGLRAQLGSVGKERSSKFHPTAIAGQLLGLYGTGA